MNLLSSIRGCKEERMASEILRYLLIECSSFRDRFADLLTQKVLDNRGSITFDNGVMCSTELTTSEVSGSNGVEATGRIDLSVESDYHLLFLENKLWANFSPKQPEKYCRQLHEDATARHKTGCLVVLCPEFRVEGITEELKSKDFVKEDGDGNIHDYSPTIISWQAVTGILQDQNCAMPTSVAIVAEMFCDFLKDYLVSEFSYPCADVLRQPVAKGVLNGYQDDMLQKLNRLMGKRGEDVKLGRCGGGSFGWYGFGVTVARSCIGDAGSGDYWLGFINPAQDSHESVLVIARRNDPIREKSLIRLLATPGWGEEWNYYEIKGFSEWVKLTEAEKVLNEALPGAPTGERPA